MLGQQIRTWDVLDKRVLQTLRDTPRELFVPETERDLAFADVEIPLPHDQCMMNPKVEARLIQELRIGPADRVLEIGTGSGYLAACLARLAEHVVSVEFFPDLSATAGDAINQLETDNIDLEVADALTLSHPKQFDAIALTASVPEIPEQFIAMLRPHGRLFAVVGRAPVMEARLVTIQANGERTEESLFETLLTPMIHAEQSEPFVL